MGPVTQLTTETDAATLTAPGEVVHAADSPDAPWWRDAVIYQVYPRSWADADGDGMGDLPGITARLPYLRDLGVDAVWLSPFYVSPMNDAGYDVADYRDIDPRFGSLADADAMVATAHDLGLKVLVDLVPNHTSSEHAWFRAALAAGPGSPERERYVFRDGAGPERRGAAEQLAVGLRRPRLDPGHRGRRHAGPVVPAHLRRHPARPELAAPGGARGVPRHPALLVRPGRRRLPGRRRARPRQARGPARLARHGRALRRGRRRRRAPPATGATSSSSAPPTGEVLDHTATGAAPMWDQDGVHEIYRGWRKVLDAYGEPGPHPVRRGVGHARRTASRATCAPTRCTRRSTSTSSTRTGTPPRCSTVIEAVAALQRRRRCADDVGAVQPRRRAARLAARAWTSRGRDPTASGPTTRSRMPCSACGARAPRPRSCWRCPAAPTSTRARSSACPSTRRCPTSSARTRPSTAPTGTVTGRDGCRVPMPWVKDAPSLGFGPGDTPVAAAARRLRRPRGRPAGGRRRARPSSSTAPCSSYRRRHRFGHGSLAWDALSSDTVIALRNTSGDGERTLLVVTNLGADPVRAARPARCSSPRAR